MYKHLMCELNYDDDDGHPRPITTAEYLIVHLHL